MIRRAVFLCALGVLCGASASAQAVTHGVTLADTSNATSYTTGSFTPAANDLLVALVFTSASAVNGTVTDSQSGTWTLIQIVAADSNGVHVRVFVRTALIASAGTTVTFDCTGDTASGAVVFVARISGMSRTGASAVRQSAGHANGAAGGTPAPAFSISALTGNPTLGLVGNRSNPAGVTEPTSWTEQADTGYATPDAGGEYVSRNSGFTGTTITWGSTSATNFAALIVEMDASALPTFKPRRPPVQWEEGGVE